MKPIVLVGHQHSCPIHGSGTAVSGASEAAVDGRAVACVGDRTSCEAIIQTGSPGTIFEDWYMVACYSPKLIELDWSSMSISQSSHYTSYAMTVPLEYDPKLEIEIHYPLPGKIFPPIVDFDIGTTKPVQFETAPQALQNGSERRSYTFRGVGKRDRGSFGVKFSYKPKDVDETLVARVRPGADNSIESQGETDR